MLAERHARKFFEGTVEYEYKNLDEFTFSFDTTGGTQHITQSYQTRGYASPGCIPPNHCGAIGVNDREIAGCDVILPTLSFTMTRTRTGVLDLPFIKFIASMTGQINSEPFLSFQPGGVLFEVASGSQRIANMDSPLNYSMLSPHMFKTAKPTVFEDFSPLDYKHYWRTDREHSHDVVRCNHYRYRSREDWEQKVRRGNGNDAKLFRYCMSLEEWHKHGNSKEHIFDDTACRFAERVKEVLN